MHPSVYEWPGPDSPNYTHLPASIARAQDFLHKPVQNMFIIYNHIDTMGLCADKTNNGNEV